MMKKKFICCFTLLMLAAFPASAELSANPWLEPNTEEDVAEVYNTTGEVSVKSEEDAKVYMKIPEKKSDGEGIVAKIKGMFSSDDEQSSATETTVSRPDPNQQVLARRRSLSGRKKTAVHRSGTANDGNDGLLDGVDVPGVDVSGIVNKVKGFNLKSLGNVFK